MCAAPTARRAEQNGGTSVLRGLLVLFEENRPRTAAAQTTDRVSHHGKVLHCSSDTCGIIVPSARPYVKRITLARLASRCQEETIIGFCPLFPTSAGKCPGRLVENDPLQRRVFHIVHRVFHRFSGQLFPHISRY